MTNHFKHKQRGITLIITLIAVVLLSIAGIATFKALDSGATLIGNLNMRNTATQAGDIGVEAARAWLLAQSTDMDANPSTHVQLFWSKPATGQGMVTTVNGVATTGAAYLATWGDFSPTTHDWTNDSITLGTLPTSLSGFTVQWVIHRMCEHHAGIAGTASAGYTGLPTDAATNCIRVSAAGSGNSQLIQVQARQGANTEHPYYRVTVRIQAPFRSVTYVQAVTY